MIHSLLLLLATLPQEESPRLRTILPNKAVIFVERIADAKTVSVQLFASSKRVPETSETSGRRHLLEHVLAKGPKKNLDQRLESNGAFLVARTHRDATQFEILCGSSSLDLALGAVSELLKPIETTPAELQKETAIIDQEITLLHDSQRLSIAAWQGGYGEEGSDPVGSVEAIGKTTVADLQALQKAHFAPDCLVVVVAGPVKLDDVTARVKRILSDLKPLTDVTVKRRGEAKPGRAEVARGFGEARAAPVGSYKEVRTIAAIAAAFAVATHFDAAFVTYTPTVQNGLVLVGQTESNTGVGLKIDNLADHEEAALFPVGKMLARSWIERQMASPGSLASLRGLLLVQGISNQPETILQMIDQLTFEQFRAGMKLFKSGQAVIAVGMKG